MAIKLVTESVCPWSVTENILGQSQCSRESIVMHTLLLLLKNLG